jgi:hypothetical protein
MRFLPILLLPITLFAQDPSKVNDAFFKTKLAHPILDEVPHDAVIHVKYKKLDRKEMLYRLCSSVNRGYKVQGYPAFFSTMLYFEGYDISHLNSPGDAYSDELKHVIKELWEKKYSKCNCEQFKDEMTPIDAIAIYNGKAEWVDDLYNPELINSNPNLVRSIDYRVDFNGTLVDYLDRLAVSDNTKIKSNQKFKESVEAWSTKLKSYGMKNISNMTAQEIKGK